MLTNRTVEVLNVGTLDRGVGQAAGKGDPKIVLQGGGGATRRGEPPPPFCLFWG